MVIKMHVCPVESSPHELPAPSHNGKLLQRLNN
jgi:hypothetical protein